MLFSFSEVRMNNSSRHLQSNNYGLHSLLSRGFLLGYSENQEAKGRAEIGLRNELEPEN